MYCYDEKLYDIYNFLITLKKINIGGCTIPKKIYLSDMDFVSLYIDPNFGIDTTVFGLC